VQTTFCLSIAHVLFLHGHGQLPSLTLYHPRSLLGSHDTEDQLAVVPFPTFPQPNCLNEILMHASIQGKHRHGRDFLLFDDRRSSRYVDQSIDC
jgi:hypothetical protein